MSGAGSAEDALSAILSRVGPAPVAATVRELAGRKRASAESGVSLPDVIESLIGDADLGKGSERWSAYLRIKQAVIEAVGRVPGLRYVEGDA